MKGLVQIEETASNEVERRFKIANDLDSLNADEFRSKPDGAGPPKRTSVLMRDHQDTIRIPYTAAIDLAKTSPMVTMTIAKNPNSGEGTSRD